MGNSTISLFSFLEITFHLISQRHGAWADEISHPYAAYVNGIRRIKCL